MRTRFSSSLSGVKITFTFLMLAEVNSFNVSAPWLLRVNSRHVSCDYRRGPFTLFSRRLSSNGVGQGVQSRVSNLFVDGRWACARWITTAKLQHPETSIIRLSTIRAIEYDSVRFSFLWFAQPPHNHPHLLCRQPLSVLLVSLFYERVVQLWATSNPHHQSVYGHVWVGRWEVEEGQFLLGVWLYFEIVHIRE